MRSSSNLSNDRPSSSETSHRHRHRAHSSARDDSRRHQHRHRSPPREESREYRRRSRSPQDVHMSSREYRAFIQKGRARKEGMKEMEKEYKEIRRRNEWLEKELQKKQKEIDEGKKAMMESSNSRKRPRITYNTEPEESKELAIQRFQQARLHYSREIQKIGREREEFRRVEEENQRLRREIKIKTEKIEKDQKREQKREHFHGKLQREAANEIRNRVRSAKCVHPREKFGGVVIVDRQEYRHDFNERKGDPRIQSYSFVYSPDLGPVRCMDFRNMPRMELGNFYMFFTNDDRKKLEYRELGISTKNAVRCCHWQEVVPYRVRPKLIGNNMKWSVSILYGRIHSNKEGTYFIHYMFNKVEIASNVAQNLKANMGRFPSTEDEAQVRIRLDVALMANWEQRFEENKNNSIFEVTTHGVIDYEDIFKNAENSDEGIFF